MNGRTQVDRILAHLQSGRSITPLGALRRFGCFRLAARVRDLRKAGISVRSSMVRRNGKHYARYQYP
jgi:hypothetical protein